MREFLHTYSSRPGCYPCCHQLWACNHTYLRILSGLGSTTLFRLLGYPNSVLIISPSASWFLVWVSRGLLSSTIVSLGLSPPEISSNGLVPSLWLHRSIRLSMYAPLDDFPSTITRLGVMASSGSIAGSHYHGFPSILLQKVSFTT